MCGKMIDPIKRNEGIMNNIKSIVVYSKPACVQCNMTYRALDKKGYSKEDYTILDITEDPEAFAYVSTLGFLSAPVVEVTYEDGTVDQWAGFNDDKIRELASA